MKPHKHAELIKAWADGAEIQYRWSENHDWDTCQQLTWYEDCYYRINTQPKPDVVKYLKLNYPNKNQWFESNEDFEHDCIKIVRDGETGKLKSAEVWYE